MPRKRVDDYLPFFVSTAVKPPRWCVGCCLGFSDADANIRRGAVVQAAGD